MNTKRTKILALGGNSKGRGKRMEFHGISSLLGLRDEAADMVFASLSETEFHVPVAAGEEATL